MLWMLEIPQVELLLGLWISLMVYAAIATIFIRVNFLIKILIIPIIFIVAYQSLIVSDILPGNPSYSQEEDQGTLNGYVVFEKNNKKLIAVLLNTRQGPMLYAVPYDPEMEKNLSQAMNKLTQQGIPTLVRKKGKLSVQEGQQADGQDGEASDSGQQGKHGKAGKFGNQTEGPLEFYDFVEQYLVPKNPSP